MVGRGVELELRVRSERALHEQLDGGAPRDRVLDVRRRQRERLHDEQALAPDSQRCPARHEHPDVGGLLQDLSDEQRRRHQVLEVVQHEQQLVGLEVADQGVGPGPLRAVALADRGRDLGDDQSGIGQPLKADEDRAVAVLALDPAGELDPDPRLADASRTDERHEPDVGIGEQTLDDSQLRFAPDQPRRRPRQVRGGPGRRWRRGRRCGAGAVEQQQRVALQHPRVQASQLLAGLQPKLGRERASGTSERVERIGLAPGPVQRQHQLAPQSLFEPVLAGEQLELGDELGAGAGGEVTVDPEQQRLQVFLFERSTPLRDAPLARNVGEPVAADQRQRLRDERAGAVGVGTRVVDQLVETPRVDLELARPQRVAAGVADDELAKQVAQLGEVDVQGGDRARGRAFAPQLVDQPIAGERDATGHQEQRQQRALMAARQRHLVTIPVQDQRTQHPEAADLGFRVPGVSAENHHVSPPNSLLRPRNSASSSPSGLVIATS